MTERISGSERKQLIWLAYWELRHASDGIPPTDAEIGKRTGYKSRGQSYNIIAEMIAEGWFAPRAKHMRNLRPLRPESAVYCELGETACAIWNELATSV